MSATRAVSPKVSAALALGAFVTSLGLAGCGGASTGGAPTPEEAPKRAKYMDLHPEPPKVKPRRVPPPTTPP